MAPEFATEAYWDKFFMEKPGPYEWLLQPAEIYEPIAAIIKHCLPNAHSQLLHIGCGSSELSWKLQEIVDTADQIHNVDYSVIAIQNGIVANQRQVSQLSTGCQTQMRWSRVDLLSLSSIEDGELGSYAAIIDKGTSDSIALGEDIKIDLPYRLTERTGNSGADSGIAVVHPLSLLAVHLAALAPPNVGRWIAISFSDDRFPFMTCSDTSRPMGLPDPVNLWTLENKFSVAAPPETLPCEPAAYKPDVKRWIYILRRTEQELKITA